MRIDRRILLDSESNQIFGTAAISLTTFIFAYSIIFGQISILIFYALWLPFLVLKPALLLKGLGHVSLLLLLPAVAVLSTLWSDYPAVTLRGSLQYASTVVCGVIAARMISAETLARGGLIGSAAVILYSLAYGEYGYDAIDGTYSFAGAFGSKNSFGFFGSTGLIFAVAIIWLFRSGWRWTLLSLGVAGLSAYALSIAASATSTITAVASLAVMAVAKFSLAFAPVQRRVLLAGGLVVIAGIVAWASATGAVAQIFEIFGKDATLTGRTFLWREGLKVVYEHPILGVGYYAFWVPGRPLAEELWESFYISARSGFHFHNTLIESGVELGMVGIAMAGAILIGLVVEPLRSLIGSRHAASAILCTVLAILFAVRSAVEVEFLTPYKMGSFMVPFLLIAMWDARHVECRGRQTPLHHAGSSRGSDAAG